jgi:hypothetical protein
VVHGDNRDFFQETYRRNMFAEFGVLRRIADGLPFLLVPKEGWAPRSSPA